MKILIIPNYKKEQTAKALEKTLKVLEDCNAEYETVDLPDKKFVYNADFPCDVVLYIGGDGTFIRSATLAHRLNVPIIGINTGKVGHLSKIGLDEIDKKVPELLNGNYEIENIDVLKLEYGDNVICPIINDAVFASSSLVNDFTVTCNNEVILDNRASAVSVATCIGSTGLNKSAGGAVILPKACAICFTAICPQSGDRNSVVGSSKEMYTVKSNEAVNVYIDGEFAFIADDKIKVYSDDKSLKIIK